MTADTRQQILPPRIEGLKVRNFRSLQNIEFRKLTPITVLLGPNGSGKSTLFDVFAFLAECFESGLRKAWDRRGRARELKTRGANGPVAIEIKYRERHGAPLITYHISVDERKGAPVVAHEWVSWRRRSHAAPFRFLEYKTGAGHVVSGEQPEAGDRRVEIPLSAPDLLAVNTLGQFRDYPRVAALRNFIMGWHVSCLSAEAARGQPEAGPEERLSRTGGNLADVIRHLAERHPARLEAICATLRRYVPRVEKVLSHVMPDGRLLLQVKDAPFKQPVPARFVSDGTLKLLACLTLLYDPEPPPLIGMGEPENFLHPRLLPELAEECRAASERTQMLVATHSPFFVDALRPDEVRLLWRDENGHARIRTAADIPGVKHFMDEGALLGALWMEGQFRVGDPLTRSGAPAPQIAGCGA